MRHTKKNRKKRRNGKNKQRFSKKRIGGIGFGSLSKAVTGVTNAITDRTKSFIDVNSPINKLNRQLFSGQEITANEINTVSADQYDKIDWKHNKGSEVKPYITLDGVEALYNKAKEYINNHTDYANSANDISILLSRVNVLKNLQQNDKPKEDILSTEIANIEENTPVDKLKEIFCKILTTGEVKHLQNFTTICKTFKKDDIINFDDFINNEGNTPLMMIVSNQNPELLSHVLNTKNGIKDKISFGTNEKNGQNILHIAANNKNPKIMQIIFDENNGIKDKIIEYGFINLRNNIENLPIDILCNNIENIGEDYFKNIELLIDNRSNFYAAYDIIKTKINNFTQLIKKRTLTGSKQVELNDKLNIYNKIMKIFDNKNKEIIKECDQSLTTKYTNDATKYAITKLNEKRWINKLKENEGREQITDETEKTTFDTLFATKLNELKNNDKDVFKNYPCDLVVDDKVQDDNIAKSTNEANNTPKQGGRRRVTKRLQHNLRRYKL